MSNTILKKNGKAFTMVLSSDNASSGQSHDFRTRFSPPLDLSGSDRWAVSLIRADTWFTFYNINVDYNNQTFRYYNGSVYRNVSIPAGVYSAGDLITEIESLITAEGDSPLNLVWSANVNTQKFVLTLASGFKVDFTNLPIRTIFGADSTEYAASTEMPSQAALSNGVNQWLINTDIVDFSMFGKFQGNVLHAFAPAVKPGSAILIEPQPVYVLVRNVKLMQDARVYLTDQTGRALSVQGSPVSVQLHFVGLNEVKV